MALRYADRVKESTSNRPATSATAFNLGGPRTGFQSFTAAIGNGSRCVACAQAIDSSGNPAGAWQIFVGTVTDAATDTLSQDYLISSSSGSFVDWSATGEDSSPDVFIVSPAAIASQRELMSDTTRWLTTMWQFPVESAFFQVDKHIAQPVFVPEPCLLTGLRMNWTAGSAVGRKCIIGVYDDTGGYPGGKVAQSAELDGASTGIKSDVSLSVFLKGGRYWLTWLGNNNAASYSGKGSSNIGIGVSSWIFGAQDGTFTLNQGPIQVDLTYTTTLPSVYGTTGKTTRSSDFPMIQYKLSAF